MLKNLLETPESELELRWRDLEAWLQITFKKTLSIEGMLFMIGLQESHIPPKRRLEKEQKQELIVTGSYHVLAALDLYKRNEEHPDGWEATQAIPKLSLPDQEKLIKLGLLIYFDRVRQ
ncbi:MAG TPA: hypothetical protein PLO56_09650 [Rhodothermales bacterium]|nr:hypothetical protein [Rhodothermales bacterium]